MSIVTVQLGQCGNQLGSQLFDMLNDEVPEWGHERERFFRYDYGTERGLARTVLVDMEPKAVNACLRKGARPSAKWAYDSNNVVIQQSGSGNNWALGYHHHGSRCVEAVIERVRSEVEHCDYFGGFLLLQSLAGGTGAGLGSRVAEEMSINYPSFLQVSYAVWPYDTGEVLVQAYNTLLSINKLLATCDGVVITRNEDLAATCAAVHNQPRPAFQDLNAVAAHALASLLCPARLRPTAVPLEELSSPVTPSDARMKSPPLCSHSGSRSSMTAPSSNSTPALSRAPVSLGRGFILGDVLSQVASHPSFRVLTLRTAPQVGRDAVKFTTFSWDAILKRLLQMFITRTTCSERLDWSQQVAPVGVVQGYRGKHNKSAGSFAVVRGQYAAQVDVACLRDPGLYPAWLDDPLMVAASSGRFQKYEMTSTMLSADQACIEPLQMAAKKCGGMLHANAFVHQYENQGLGKGEITEAMHSAMDVAEAYANM